MDWCLLPSLLRSQACGRKILLPKKVPDKHGKEAKCPLHPPLGKLQSWERPAMGETVQRCQES